jgi:hypothetical protein
MPRNAQLGDPDEAFKWLARAREIRDPGLTGNVYVDPILDPLRTDPRYDALVRDLGFAAKNQCICLAFDAAQILAPRRDQSHRPFGPAVTLECGTRAPPDGRSFPPGARHPAFGPTSEA